MRRRRPGPARTPPPGIPATAAAGQHRRVATARAPAAIGPYAQAVEAGDMLFVSGQIGLDPESGQIVPGGIVAEAEQVLENLVAILLGAGYSRAEVVRTTLYLTDLADFPAVNEVYARYFTDPYPSRVTVQVVALPRGARIEVEAVAVRSGGGRPGPAR